MDHHLGPVSLGHRALQIVGKAADPQVLRREAPVGAVVNHLVGEKPVPDPGEDDVPLGRRRLGLLVEADRVGREEEALVRQPRAARQDRLARGVEGLHMVRGQVRQAGSRGGRDGGAGQSRNGGKG